MSQHNLISIDLAENVFQICGVTDRQSVIFNRQLKRKDLVAFMINQSQVEDAMEACYSSHYWGRHFESMGHQVKLIPAQHVTTFVRDNKSDHNDAIAIGEAARRPNLKSVPIKLADCRANMALLEQQGIRLFQSLYAKSLLLSMKGCLHCLKIH
jgi:transposase